MNKGHELAAVIGRAKEAGAAKVKPKHYSDGSERVPHRTSGWRKAKDFLPHLLRPAISVSGWRRGNVFVASALELADPPDADGAPIPQWHISVSVRTGDRANPARRATDGELRATAACFWMTGAEEDNHHPGVARHLWLPVDPSRRVDCECKVAEAVVVEPDGYRYSEKIGKCAGCELEAATFGAQKCQRHRDIELDANGDVASSELTFAKLGLTDENEEKP